MTGSQMHAGRGGLFGHREKIWKPCPTLASRSAYDCMLSRTRSTLTDAELASPREAARSLASLSAADQRRLELIARARSDGLSALDWKDLLQESIVRMLDGSRRWPRRVPLVAFLAQTMRSIASDARSRPAELELHDDNVGADESLLNDIEAAEQLRRIRSHFEGDLAVLDLISGIQLGETAKETQLRAGLGSADYDAARKRFWRGIAALNGGC
jgi:hypothetical protein